MGGKRPPAASAADCQRFDLNELILTYWHYVVGYYVKDGKPTSEQETIRQALRFLKATHGHIAAKDLRADDLAGVIDPEGGRLGRARHEQCREVPPLYRKPDARSPLYAPTI